MRKKSLLCTLLKASLSLLLLWQTACNDNPEGKSRTEVQLTDELIDAFAPCHSNDLDWEKDFLHFKKVLRDIRAKTRSIGETISLPNHSRGRGSVVNVATYFRASPKLLQALMDLGADVDCDMDSLREYINNADLNFLREGLNLLASRGVNLAKTDYIGNTCLRTFYFPPESQLEASFSNRLAILLSVDGIKPCLYIESQESYTPWEYAVFMAHNTNMAKAFISAMNDEEARKPTIKKRDTTATSVPGPSQVARARQRIQGNMMSEPDKQAIRDAFLAIGISKEELESKQ